MTSLEVMVRTQIALFHYRHEAALDAWEHKAKAEIRAMAIARRRGIATIVNHMLLRLTGRRSTRALRAITDKGTAK